MGDFKQFIDALPALGVMALSTFVVCLSATLTQTIAFDIRMDLGAMAGNRYQWMFPAFIAGECATMALCGAVMDRIGRRWPFAVGSALFVIGTAICALSDNMDLFLLGRIVEGAGAGTVIVTCIAQIFFTVENKKLRYISNGIMSLGFGAGMLFGIFFGKLMLDAVGWVNYLWILLALQAVFTVPCFLVMGKGENSDRKTDIVGGTILAVTVAFFVYFLEKVYLGWGMHDTEFRAGICVLLLLSMAFVIAEMKIPHSMAHRAVDDRKMMAGCLILITLLGLIDMATVGWMVKTALFTYELSVTEAAPYFVCVILGSATAAVVISEVIDRTGHLVWIVLSAIFSPLALHSVKYIQFNESTLLLGAHLYIIGLGIGCLITLLNATIQNRTDKNSNGGFVSYAIMLRTAALWLGYNIYQAAVDGYMNDRLAGVMETVRMATGKVIPTDSTVAGLLITPMKDGIIRIQEMLHIPLVEDIGTAFVGGVGEGFTVMGTVFCIAVLVTAAVFVGRRKLV